MFPPGLRYVFFNIESIAILGSSDPISPFSAQSSGTAHDFSQHMEATHH